MPKIESIIDFYDVKSLHSKFAFTFHLVLGIKVTKNSAKFKVVRKIWSAKYMDFNFQYFLSFKSFKPAIKCKTSTLQLYKIVILDLVMLKFPMNINDKKLK